MTRVQRSQYIVIAHTAILRVNCLIKKQCSNNPGLTRIMDAF